MSDSEQLLTDDRTRVGHCKRDTGAVEVYVGRGPDGRALS